jgi:hypothetical protein
VLPGGQRRGLAVTIATTEACPDTRRHTDACNNGNSWRLWRAGTHAVKGGASRQLQNGRLRLRQYAEVIG